MTLSSKKIAAMKPRDKRYSVADGNGLTLRVFRCLFYRICTAFWLFRRRWLYRADWIVPGFQIIIYLRI